MKEKTVASLVCEPEETVVHPPFLTTIFFIFFIGNNSKRRTHSWNFSELLFPSILHAFIYDYIQHKHSLYYIYVVRVRPIKRGTQQPTTTVYLDTISTKLYELNALNGTCLGVEFISYVTLSCDSFRKVELRFVLSVQTQT